MDPIVMALIGGAGYLMAWRRGFTCKYRNGSWRAYFNGNPPSMSHVLSDDYGYYVCWDTPLRSREEAQQAARQWMRTYG